MRPEDVRQMNESFRVTMTIHRLYPQSSLNTQEQPRADPQTTEGYDL